MEVPVPIFEGEDTVGWSVRGFNFNIIHGWAISDFDLMVKYAEENSSPTKPSQLTIISHLHSEMVLDPLDLPNLTWFEGPFLLLRPSNSPWLINEKVIDIDYTRRNFFIFNRQPSSLEEAMRAVASFTGVK